MVDVSSVGIDGLLVALLRQIVGGDCSQGNLWLCLEMISLFMDKWDSLLEEEPLVLTSALYVNYKILKFEVLKRKEIEFSIRMLRKQFHLCLKIGRDLVRLLQDLVHIPDFRAIWKDLVLNPSEFKTDGFADISQIYHARTSSMYFVLRITLKMWNYI
ncbi:hypothetical protein Leryth_025183 [Lithospermum erythrorhizon]|nr:hypothetical protein Leryth_025183 [Lithospermum erythrorhizon]